MYSTGREGGRETQRLHRAARRQLGQCQVSAKTRKL